MVRNLGFQDVKWLDLSTGLGSGEGRKEWEMRLREMYELF